MYLENNWQLRRPEHFGETSPAQRIAFVLTDSCDLLGVVAIAEALECACSLAPPGASCRYEMLFLSETGGRVRCDALVIYTDALDVTEKTRFDRVIIAAGAGSRAVRDAALRASWLQRMVANGTAVKFLTAGTGTLRVDAPAGLREGGGAVGYGQAHWRRAQLQSALAAASDVIRADFGTYIAHEALRRTAPVGSDEWIVPPVDTGHTIADRTRAAARWLQHNCHRPVCMADIAAACAMSQRTLLRNFRTYMGSSPSAYLQQVRLELACELLAHTSLPAHKVARRVGLSSGDRLAKLFRRVIGRSPTEYRAWRRGEESGHGHN